MSRGVHIDATISGSTTIVVPVGGATVHVVAFANDEDQSSVGSVHVDSATITGIYLDPTP
jgi:hypothetical protein